MNAILKRDALERVLLTTLSGHAEGVNLHDVYDEIDRDYEFPAEWYRQIPAEKGHDMLAEQGISDWRTVPQERLVEIVPTEPQWQNELRWARNDLRKKGYLDRETARGIWKLSAAGLRAAQQAEATETGPEELGVVRLRRTVEPKPEPSVIGRRARMLTSLDHLTHSMPLADLGLLVDIARAIRRRGLADAA